jgi:hypothetical protein
MKWVGSLIDIVIGFRLTRREGFGVSNLENNRRGAMCTHSESSFARDRHPCDGRTDVFVEPKRPPKDILEHTLSHNYFRFLGPDGAIAVGMRVKETGEGLRGEDKELSATEDLTLAMLPCERLLGDAMHGDATLFGRQDTIGAQ